MSALTDGPMTVGRAAWQGLRNQTHSLLWALALALILLVPGGLWMTLGEQFGKGALASIAAMVLIGIYVAVIQSLLRQNHPHLARLVPDHVHALQRSALLIWLVGAVLSAAISLWQFGNPLSASLPVLLLMLTTAWALRHPLLWAFMWVPFPFIGWLSKIPALSQAWQALWVQAQTHPWLALMLLLAAGGMLLIQLFGHGDEAHQRRFRRQQTWRAAAKAQKPVTLNWPAGSFFDRLQRLARLGYTEALRRASASPARGPVRHSRALLVLGPQSHWATHLAQLALMICIFALIALFAQVFEVRHSSTGHEVGSYTGFIFGTVAYVMSVVQGMRVALYNTRHEQALLSLVPGMARGRVLNRAIAARLMLQFLLLWSLVSLVQFLLVGSALLTHRQLLSAAMASLPMGVWLWSDWSRAKALQGGQLAMLYLLPALLSILLLALLSAGWIEMLPLTLLELALLAPVALWRWRLALGAPSAFPAGRLA